jgi:outer membrane protein OmpA-like peptidoglycan-associated protein
MENQMQKSITLIATVAIAGLLAACSNNTAEIAKMKVKGGAYEKGLHKGYLKLAKLEHSEDDWGDAGSFEERAKMAAMGKPTGPEMVSARELKMKHKKELSVGYNRLLASFKQGGAQKAGREAALAQTNFDCWMQEAEEDMQPQHISACRSMFYGALAMMEEKLKAPKAKMAKKVKKKKARKPQTVDYVLYFDFNSAKLNSSAQAAIDFMKSNVKKNAKVSLAAFTDRAGDDKYNKSLAAARAKMVYDALDKLGLENPVAIKIYGEEKASVATKDGVKERLNRRVEVYVTQ